jgi:hypothetical protein
MRLAVEELRLYVELVRAIGPDGAFAAKPVRIRHCPATV